MSFASLGLSAPLLKAVAEQGYKTPTPIQVKAIPAIIKGRDVMAAAQTGTGKTAGFTLPLLERLAKGQAVRANHVRVLVLTPTRELAAQVGESVATYGKHTPLRCQVVFGGVGINPQMMKLRKGADVLVATPGRLLDLFYQNAVQFKDLEILVLDEADRMLDMGFIHDIRKIINLLPQRRQNLLFSATFSEDIRELARDLMHHPAEISVSSANPTAQNVKQWICPVDKKRKPALLAHLIQKHKWKQVLVFTRTKQGADRLTRQLDAQGLKATAIHGDKTQGVRTKALAEFKQGEISILVATDIAARGLDIEQLPQVVNFDLPNVPQDYVHRIGRTGRASAKGQAVSLVSADEFKQLCEIEQLIKQILPRKLVDDFEPTHDLPASHLNRRAVGPKKPKKPKQQYKSAAEQRKSSSAASKAGRHKPSRKAKQQTAGTKKYKAKPGRRSSKASKSRSN